jgi:hypothetical protein
MTPWQQFYQSVRESNWPDCEREEQFGNLPAWIQHECTTIHGYTPGEYRQQSRLLYRRFPIATDTACQLKWTWSTVYLTLGMTASCHRTNHHRFDTDTFDFHNTPNKIEDRGLMLQGQWPNKGCDYCKQIEKSGGISDRMTNLDLAGIHAPPELQTKLTAVTVTPRILEVYFDNVCNLKCVYCGPHFSSLWDAENKKYGHFESNGLIISDRFSKDINFSSNKNKLFTWLEQNGQHLTNFNMLGGEPLFQDELQECLDFFERVPMPDLDFQIFSNLNTKNARLIAIIDRIKSLIDRDHLRAFTVTASLDCWGERAEYARFPLDLETWQKNFETLLAHPWIKLVIGSTITPLTITTLPELIEKINTWNQIRKVSHYFNSVDGPSYMMIDILGDVFKQDFQRALCLMPDHDQHQRQVRSYLEGIGLQSVSKPPNPTEATKLRVFLGEMDRRRGTDWKRVFPELAIHLEFIDRKEHLTNNSKNSTIDYD